MTSFTPEQAQVIRALLTTKQFGTWRTFVEIDTMLRASDLLGLSPADVTDHSSDVVSEINIRQKKTNQGHLVALSSETHESLADWILYSVKKSGEYLWTSIGNRKTRPHLTREQYANLVKQWAYLARLDPKRHSTHSMSRTNQRSSMKKHRT